MKSTDSILRDIFNDEFPLGPISSNEFNSYQHKEIFHAYFDTDNFSYQQIKRNPTMIVGRKGSGKTDALISQAIDRNLLEGTEATIVYFSDKKAANSLSLVLSQVVSAIQESYPGPMVESVAEFWDGLFWLCICATLVLENKGDETPEINILEQYLIQYDINEEISLNPYRVLLKATKALREIYHESGLNNVGFGFFQSLPEINLGNITLRDAKFAAKNWLMRNGQSAYILFDSVEAIDLTNEDNDLVISALLKAIGDFAKPGVPVKFRCCIPSESYFHLSELSSNTIKDFRSVMVLQWTSGELLRIAAKRFLKYIQLWHSDEFEKFTDAFLVSERSGAIGFWKMILPDIVRNSRDKRAEGTLTYILRHTQLLPRHLIYILNNIVRRALSENESDGFPRISAQAVVQEVQSSEEEIVSQILDSYSGMWPDANGVLEELLPRIEDNIIKYNKLQKIFNNSGAKPLMGGLGFKHTIKMLAEIGAVGRLIRTTERFHTGVFEYSEPNRLIFTPDDMLCVHPVFSSRYRAIKPGLNPDGFRPVYPYSIDPDTPDLRKSASPLFNS
ncbi:hypothetical protein N9W89_05425 [Hellea sp.]|nr:hypothetical protein [Hellea sp.]